MEEAVNNKVDELFPDGVVIPECFFNYNTCNTCDDKNSCDFRGKIVYMSSHRCTIYDCNKSRCEIIANNAIK